MLLKIAFVWGAEPYGFPKAFLAAPLLCLLRRQITMFIHKEKATMTILFVVFLSLLFKSFKQETCQITQACAAGATAQSASHSQV